MGHGTVYVESNIMSSDAKRLPKISLFDCIAVLLSFSFSVVVWFVYAQAKLDSSTRVQDLQNDHPCVKAGYSRP